MGSLALLLVFGSAAFAAGREVAITIDDLPRNGADGASGYAAVSDMTARLLAPLREQRIPVTGFVNAGQAGFTPQELRRILDQWLDAGADLGNHTYSHPNLNTSSIADYEADIVKGEPAIRVALEARGKKLEFFRYPFLMTGPTVKKKHAIAEFIAARGYRNAVVTFDDADYMFAAAFHEATLAARVKREYVPYLESVIAFFERRSVAVAGREFPQILLLHAHELNAQTMPDILAMFRRRGYAFVSLDRALRDEAYKMPENYVGSGGFSWIHRWSRAKGVANQGEPDEPQWLHEWYTRRRS
jgi:peptidoglycan/xylan/chitin deacetylase (PgdA/CDA1 family)